MSRAPAQRTATRRGATPAQQRKQVARTKQPGLMDQALAALPFSRGDADPHRDLGHRGHVRRSD